MERLACSISSWLGSRFPGLYDVAGITAGPKLGQSGPWVALPGPESVFCWNARGLPEEEVAAADDAGVGPGDPLLFLKPGAPESQRLFQDLPAHIIKNCLNLI